MSAATTHTIKHVPGLRPQKLAVLPLDEIWALQLVDGSLVPCVDVVGDPFMAFVSEADAKAAVEAQYRMYAIAAFPVRIK